MKSCFLEVMKAAEILISSLHYFIISFREYTLDAEPEMLWRDS